MQEIQEYNKKLSKQRRSSSILIGLLLSSGFVASVPMFSDSIKHEETLYCNIKSSCKPSQLKRGISFLVDRERRNQLFDNNIKIIKILPPEDSTAVGYGVLSSLFLLSAYGVSKALTNYQEKSIHSQFKMLKIKALENDLVEQNHLDLFGFSKQNQGLITKEVISRQTAETVQQLKSEGELQLDALHGHLQGQLSLKSHQLQLSELDRETAKNTLESLELQRKIDKLSGKNKPDEQPKLSPNEELKNSLIDALKQHENGWLWSVITNKKPLWIIGGMGSGKTWTSCTFALIRKHCLGADIEYLIDRHYHGDNLDIWQYLQPKNTAESEEEIKSTFQELAQYWMDRIKAKPTNFTQTVVDEFTHLRSITGDIADTIFKLHLSDCRKAKNLFCGVTHSSSNESFAPGSAAMRKAGMILIQKFSKDGEKPLDRVVVRYGLNDINGNELEDIERTLPVWFSPQKIHNHFNGKPINFEE
ncbi:MAG: hypothetical protein RLZZ29_783 [Cyanobacteriota bacterium]|jgi:hypothetical protein